MLWVTISGAVDGRVLRRRLKKSTGHGLVKLDARRLLAHKAQEGQPAVQLSRLRLRGGEGRSSLIFVGPGKRWGDLCNRDAQVRRGVERSGAQEQQASPACACEPWDHVSAQHRMLPKARWQKLTREPFGCFWRLPRGTCPVTLWGLMCKLRPRLTSWMSSPPFASPSTATRWQEGHPPLFPGDRHTP